MWIIVEGCSLTGKSTLLAEIEKRMTKKYKSVHFGQPKTPTREAMLAEYVTRWERRGPTSMPLVADRWHWGEATYAQVYRPDTSVDGFGLLGRAGWRWTELFLASRGASLAYLTAKNEVLAKRLADRGDDHVQNTDELFRIASLYEGARRDSITMAASFDTSDIEDEQERYAEFIDSLITEATVRAKTSRKIRSEFPYYIGGPKPSALLVDYKMGNFDKTMLPTIPLTGTREEFLLGVLPDLFWRSCGIVNAATNGDTADLVKALGSPPVVAIGPDAHSNLDAWGVEHASVLDDPGDVIDASYEDRRSYGQLIVETASYKQ